MLTRKVRRPNVTQLMLRLLASLLFTLALLVGPALCMGGLLEHECEGDGMAQCEHEDCCADDPCETLARPDAPNHDESCAAQSLTIQLIMPGIGTRSSELPRRDHREHPAPPLRSRWPYVAQNRPLLI
ncbi:MAG: hypothetical protein ACI8X5_001145 [Planctomycetota bacterium]|jgi:hypothetical protein